MGMTAFAVSAVQAQSPTQLQKILQADYNSQDAAFGRNDPLGATAYFASDFVVTNRATGHVTRNELTHQRALVTEIHQIASKSATAHTNITQFTLNKEKTQANVIIQTRYVAVGVNHNTGKTVTTIISGVYQETWAKRAGGWRITEQQKISTRAPSA